MFSAKKNVKQERNKPASKGVYILPNLFTIGSIFSAFWGMLLAAGGNFSGCALAILISALLDGMDGKIARLTHSASDFGVQLDSLADAIAFGATPAFMIYLWQLKDFGRLGMAVSFLFVACGVLRLARFNVMAGSGGSKKFFTGLPIPAAGCALACLVLFQNYLPASIYHVLTGFTLFLTFILAFLMVSRVPYFAFKEFGPLRLKTFTMMVVSALVFALFIVEPKIFGFSFFLGYLISGPAYLFYQNRKDLRGLFRRKTSMLGDPPAARSAAGAKAGPEGAAVADPSADELAPEDYTQVEPGEEGFAPELEDEDSGSSSAPENPDAPESPDAPENPDGREEDSRFQ